MSVVSTRKPTRTVVSEREKSEGVRERVSAVSTRKPTRMVVSEREKSIESVAHHRGGQRWWLYW